MRKSNKCFSGYPGCTETKLHRHKIDGTVSFTRGGIFEAAPLHPTSLGCCVLHDGPALSPAQVQRRAVLLDQIRAFRAKAERTYLEESASSPERDTLRYGSFARPGVAAEHAADAEWAADLERHGWPGAPR